MFAVVALLIVYLQAECKNFFLGFLGRIEILVGHSLLEREYGSGYLAKNQQ